MASKTIPKGPWRTWWIGRRRRGSRLDSQRRNVGLAANCTIPLLTEAVTGQPLRSNPSRFSPWLPSSKANRRPSIPICLQPKTSQLNRILPLMAISLISANRREQHLSRYGSYLYGNPSGSNPPAAPQSCSNRWSLPWDTRLYDKTRKRAKWMNLWTQDHERPFFDADKNGQKLYRKVTNSMKAFLTSKIFKYMLCEPQNNVLKFHVQSLSRLFPHSIPKKPFISHPSPCSTNHFSSAINTHGVHRCRNLLASATSSISAVQN